MFDSLYIEIDGREYEMQTKRFDCLLSHYRIGDFIHGGEIGVNIYFDTLMLDSQGKIIDAEDDIHVKKTVFAVVCNAVYVDFLVTDHLATEQLRKPFKEKLTNTWQDTHRLINFITLQLAHQQNRIKHLTHLLNEMGRIAESGLHPEHIDTQKKRFLFQVSESQKRIAAGENPLQLIVECLEQKNSDYADDPVIDEDIGRL